MLGPTRIVHLALRDGSRATAQYDSDHIRPNPCFERVDVRGPCNDECNDAMEMLAQHVGYMLNSNAVRRRAEVEDAAAAARANWHPERAEPTRVLDQHLRHKLQQVLVYAGQQDDWCRHPGTLFRGVVAGFRYAQGPAVLAQLDAGDALQLVREPDNPHDPRTVRIDWQGHKLGYVPRAGNAEVARLLDAGTDLSARILTVDATAEWPPVTCCIERAHATAA